MGHLTALQIWFAQELPERRSWEQSSTSGCSPPPALIRDPSEEEQFGLAVQPQPGARWSSQLPLGSSNTQGVEISHLGWSTEQLCAWGYRDQWDPANASSGIFWAGRISLSVPLFPVFSKTTENIALTNKPIAVSSPKWCKTNSIKKRNCNRFDLLNTYKHLLCRN